MGIIAKFLKFPLIYRIFIWVLQRFPGLISHHSLVETPHLLAFTHPKPAHACHIVLLPRTALRSFTEIDPGDLFVSDLINSVKHLVDKYDLPAYRLVVNGGAYQEFPHLHFHLISDMQKE